MPPLRVVSDRVVSSELTKSFYGTTIGHANLRPYLLRPFSTLSAIVSDPVESWMRFREQYAAHREEHTPPDLYTAEENWEVSPLRSACALVARRDHIGVLGPMAKGHRGLDARVFTLVRKALRDGTMAMPASFERFGVWFAV